MSAAPAVSPSSSIHLFAGAYAVDALDESERAAFEDHLAACEDCRVEVAELSEAVTGLALAMAVPTPASLGPAVLGAITRVRPLPPLVPRGPVRRLRARGPVHPRHPRRTAALLAAACAVVLAGVGVVVGALPGGPSGGADDAAESVAAQVMAAPDARRAAVDFEQGASATVYHSDQLNRAVIVADGLPPAPSGMVYVVWLDQPGTGMVSAAFLTGEADQSVVLSGDAASADSAALTLEPLGGSPRPTSDPVAVFDFGQGA